MTQEQFAREKLRLLEGILRNQGLVSEDTIVVAQEETLPTKLGARMSTEKSEFLQASQSTSGLGMPSFPLPPRIDGDGENSSPEPRQSSHDSPAKADGTLSGLRKMRNELLAIFNDEERQYADAKAELIESTSRPIETVITRSIEQDDSILQPTSADGFGPSTMAGMPGLKLPMVVSAIP